MNKVPKIYTDDSISSFMDKLNSMSILDYEAVSQEIKNLEIRYRGYIRSEDDRTSFNYKLNFFRKSLGSIYQAHQKLSDNVDLTEKDYLVRLVCASYSIVEDSLDSDDPYARIVHFIELVHCTNISETDSKYHQSIVKMTKEEPSIKNLIKTFPDLLAATYFSRAMLGDHDDATTFFNHFEKMLFFSSHSYIYRFLFYINQGNKTKAHDDLLFIKKTYDRSQLEEAFKLGLIHRILTSDKINEWRLLISD